MQIVLHQEEAIAYQIHVTQRAANNVIYGNVINGVPRTAVNQKLQELWLKRSVSLDFVQEQYLA